MKSSTRIAILATLLLLQGQRIWASSPYTSAPHTPGFRATPPPFRPPSMRRSDDTQGPETSSGILDDTLPGWEEENEDLREFAIPVLVPLTRSSGFAVAPATKGRPSPSSLPPVRSSLLRC